MLQFYRFWRTNLFALKSCRCWHENRNKFPDEIELRYALVQRPFDTTWLIFYNLFDESHWRKNNRACIGLQHRPCSLPSLFWHLSFLHWVTLLVRRWCVGWNPLKYE